MVVVFAASALLAAGCSGDSGQARHTQLTPITPSRTAISTSATSTSGDPPPGDLSGLRLTEVLANPEGKDGGAGSPEVLEIVNSGAVELPLDGLALLARGWPRLDADELGVDDRVLMPGGLLVIRRFSDLEAAPWTGVSTDGDLLEAVAAPDADGRTLLTEAAEKLRLSARGYHRVLRVARTLADMEGAAAVGQGVGRLHIAEALSYRRLAPGR